MSRIEPPIKPSWIDKKVFQNHAKRKSDPFYHTTTWRELRQKKLSMNPICEHCEKRGIVTTAKIVDHIEPIQFGGSKTDLDNLQSLCFSCDNSKTASDSHKYNRK